MGSDRTGDGATRRRLLHLDNVVIAPHIGSASTITRQRMAAMAVDNILAVFAGQRPPWCANTRVRLRPPPTQPDRANYAELNEPR